MFLNVSVNFVVIFLCSVLIKTVLVNTLIELDIIRMALPLLIVPLIVQRAQQRRVDVKMFHFCWGDKFI